MAAFYWARTHVLKFATLSVLCGSAILLLKMFPPNATFEFKPDAVQREQGHAYVVSVVQMSDRVWALKSDGIGGHRSQLRLYEDGREFGAAHSSHPDIRSAGRGQYSHWGGGLFFSTPDDSDPRTNGRVYRAIAALELVPSIAALGWLLAFLGGAVLVRRGVAAAADAPPGLRVDRAAKRILVASELRRGVVALALASGAAAGIGALLYAWRYGDVASTSFDLFRYLPVSDALGYHNCATTLAASGSFDSSTAGWCSRRVLYPAMLASLLGVSGWSHQVVLLLQAALVGVAVAACALAVRQRYGVLAAAIMLVALIAFAWEHVIGLFVTEVAGFILGLTALCLFLAYGSRRFLLLLFVACAFLSVGLTARAGALFVFPAVALWALSMPAASFRLRLQTLAIAVAGLRWVPPFNMESSHRWADSPTRGRTFRPRCTVCRLARAIGHKRIKCLRVPLRKEKKMPSGKSIEPPSPTSAAIRGSSLGRCLTPSRISEHVVRRRLAFADRPVVGVARCRRPG